MSEAGRAAGADTCRRWDVPQLDDGGPYGPGADAGRRAREEGFEAGYREGMAAGRVQVQEQVDVLRGIVEILATPLAELDDQIEKELVELALGVARQVVYRELRTEPELVLAAVRKALGVLPVGTRQVRLHLHPDDAGLVRELLPGDEEENGWRIVEDPVQERGGCRVTTQNSQVDASLDARLARVIAAVLGESGENT